MDGLVLDAELTLAVEDMPISRIAYWFDRAVKQAELRRKRAKR